MITTGRGGAGNIRQKGHEDTEQESPKDVPEIEPSQKIFTTGRGGAGNMMPNIDREATRAAQGAEPDYDSLIPVRSPNIGRGGYGNLKAAQKSSSLLDKAKGLFSGRH